MSWFDDIEHDFDDFFHRPRKYSSHIPPNYNPRRIAAQSDRTGGQQLTRRGDFFDDFWKNFSSGKYFVGFDDNLKTKEEPDKYLISYEEEDLGPSSINIDFDKKENELIISVASEEDDSGGGHSARTYHSTLKFEKPINAEDIHGDITDHGIELVLPKEHTDDENIVHIPLSSKRAIKKK
ncbi:hypothetical protein G210_2086 [Candida maltosa Xu316]|uniref:SHSP domain-containing protein n=1 Tax=Candida maltosa (strain Xu316) TaxID=1245528 RepID=M3K5V4_CANMX|nr:hypothetical protein G210_2086 [Candida maltosa Xu316]